MKKYMKAVVIGRFQPFHNGHEKLIRQALEIASEVYVIFGSAFSFPNVKNPLTGMARVKTVHRWARENLSNMDRDRLKYKSVADFRYNDEKWKTEIRSAIDEKHDDSICMVGFDKDADSYWLREFGWDICHVEPFCVMGKPFSATLFRDEFLRAPKEEAIELARNYQYIPEVTRKMMMHYAETMEWERLHEERLHFDKEIAKFEKYPYKGSMHFCTADTVVICNNHLLVIERKFAPGKGAWALPGGHKNEDETFKACAIRELTEEVKIKVSEKVLRGSIKASHLFDHPNRTAVFNKPTVAQYIVLEPDFDGSLPKVRGADDAAKATWIPLHEVRNARSKFFDDHAEIVTYFTGI